MIARTFGCLAKSLLMVVLSKFVCGASSMDVLENLVAVIGDGIELKCNADWNQYVIWGFTSYNTSKDEEIYFGDNISSLFKSRYKSIIGQHNLIIDSVDLDHAGIYQCVTIPTDNITVSHLAVLGSSPKCSANTSGADGGLMRNGYLCMRCSIVYAGTMYPIFRWTKDNTQVISAVNTSTSNHGTLLMTTTSLVIWQLDSDDNGVKFKCDIIFQLPNNSEGKVPEYKFTWNYTANVLYGPRNLSIVIVAGRLECSADGNPTPTYKWKHVGTNTLRPGHVYKLDGTYENGSTFQCTASNGLTSETKNITIQGLVGSTASPDTSRRTFVAAAVGSGSLLLLLVIIIVACVINRKKLKGLTRTYASRFERNACNEPDLIDVDIYAYDDVVFKGQTQSENEQNGSPESPHALRVVENHRTVLESIPVYAEVKKVKGKEERERTNANCSSPASAGIKTKKKANESLNGQSYTAFGLNEDHSQTHQLSAQKKKRQVQPKIFQL